MLNNTGLLSDSTVNNNKKHTNNFMWIFTISNWCCASDLFIKYLSSLILADKKAGHSISDQCVIIYEQGATSVAIAWWIFWLSASGADKMMSAYRLAAPSFLRAFLMAISDSVRPPTSKLESLFAFLTLIHLNP